MIRLSNPPIIAIEGISGTGKTTQAQRLAKKFRSLGVGVTVVHSPSNSAFGRAPFKAENSWNDYRNAICFSLDRWNLRDTRIEPALKDGKVVIADRYLVSGHAYQWIPIQDYEKLIARDSIRPTITFLLTGAVEVFFERLDLEDKFERRGKQYLREIQDRMLKLVSASDPDPKAEYVSNFARQQNITHIPSVHAYEADWVSDKIWEHIMLMDSLWADIGRARVAGI